MSVTKSVVRCVAGILAGQGKLDPEAPVTKYGPEVADSGYDGATVRHLPDMRTGVAFREAYVERTWSRRRRPTTAPTSRRPWEPGGPRGFVRDRPEAPGRTGRHDLGPR